ncbi:fatty acid desaturase [Bdellovibrio svalbardensis]|uniref:Fatty acid desaturase n=1 Tax=Bdellovibrio svalbardensis TaxID=2972972 RepID=A0ABT6DFP6_9BACT|nr:fatty acid desaturase [Bdellovibrio svalbardensis]MDG0815665.1 fatty acid desaturase [Bdellovibrio svalbardensis]
MTEKRIAQKRIEWPVALFLIINPLATLILMPIYFYFYGFEWDIALFALIFAAATNLSITAGYHRLFSHKSYDAHPVAKALFLLIGASGFQGSALKWGSDHRRHHSHIDSEKDPYNINEGFWYAHMGWLFFKDSVDQKIQAPDLEKDWMVKFQHDYYLPLSILMGFGLPTLIGWMMGSPLGGFVIGGGLRIALTQQSTFFVNSLCHTLGKQTYSKEISARDSWFVAVLTHGEGYHNFHHKFQIDYRNGIKWYHWDPTKWVIKTLNLVGLATKLRQISNVEILKARLQAEASEMKKHGFAEDQLAAMREKIIEAQNKMKKLREDYEQFKRDAVRKREELKDAYDLKLAEIKRDLEVAHLEFQMGMKLWQLHRKSVKF